MRALGSEARDYIHDIGKRERKEKSVLEQKKIGEYQRFVAILYFLIL